MTKEERDALRLVNKIRHYEGRKALARLPKGDVGVMTSCPLARALNHGRVSVAEYIYFSARNKKKIAAFKKAHLHQITEYEFGEKDVAFFEMPTSFDRFVAWFDDQSTEEAQQLARKPK